MAISVWQQGVLMFLLGCVFLLGCAEKEPTSKGAIEDARKPVLLEDVAATAAFVSEAEVVVIGFFQDPERPEVSEFLKMVQDMQDIPFGLCTCSNVLSHYNITMNTISLFRMVDNKRQDLEIKDSEGVDAMKLGRFVQINELRWVTEYSPMTAVGLFNSTIHTHLLFFTDKSCPKHAQRMDKYREVAVLFQGKILFILVDIHAKGNDRVISYFHLKKSQLPALAAYHTLDEEQEVLSLDDEVTLETVKGFCNRFLQSKQMKENSKPEDKIFKEEL
ncbi:endoplasmic reticulum resident protein 27 [Rhineura floridana]|uniref:endoplasmic reticulum resident protein 27 n=1 Tax=Rhineura floridana TaxID=261503 RepID=UPI002AC88822|nr:endoplasmic reticulum resident protein 27 [Rhineura floridana]